MLYVHPRMIDNLSSLSREDFQKVVDEFDPIKDDPEFFTQLYDRSGIAKKYKEREEAQKEAEQKEKEKVEKVTEFLLDKLLKFRHGISPVSKNVINIRYKKKPNFDKDLVRRVENVLKDLIDFGFSDHVIERLLEFDEEGALRNVIEGNSSTDRKTNDFKSFLGQEAADGDYINDDASVATSNLEEGWSSFRGGEGTGNVSLKNKSVMKSDFGNASEINRPRGGKGEGSASVSNYKHSLKSKQDRSLVASPSKNQRET